MPYSDPAQQRRYQREWVARRRQAWLDENGPCVRCGSADELEVDHVDPEKKVSHRVWSWSAERRDAELSKCQVLCGECHAKKTIEMLTVETPHGTHSGYSYHGCRCADCLDAQASYQRQHRSKR